MMQPRRRLEVVSACSVVLATWQKKLRFCDTSGATTGRASDSSKLPRRRQHVAPPAHTSQRPPSRGNHQRLACPVAGASHAPATNDGPKPAQAPKQARALCQRAPDARIRKVLSQPSCRAARPEPGRAVEGARHERLAAAGRSAMTDARWTTDGEVNDLGSKHTRGTSLQVHGAQPARATVADDRIGSSSSSSSSSSGRGRGKLSRSQRSCQCSSGQRSNGRFASNAAGAIALSSRLSTHVAPRRGLVDRPNAVDPDALPKLLAPPKTDPLPEKGVDGCLMPERPKAVSARALREVAAPETADAKPADPSSWAQSTSPGGTAQPGALPTRAPMAGERSTVPAAVAWAASAAEAKRTITGSSSDALLTATARGMPARSRHAMSDSSVKEWSGVRPTMQRHKSRSVTPLPPALSPRANPLLRRPIGVSIPRYVEAGVGGAPTLPSPAPTAVAGPRPSTPGVEARAPAPAPAPAPESMPSKPPAAPPIPAKPRPPPSPISSLIPSGRPAWGAPRPCAGAGGDRSCAPASGIPASAALAAAWWVPWAPYPTGA